MALLDEEEDLIMTPEIRGEFEKLRRTSLEEHQQTRAMITELTERLNEHLIESAIYRDRFTRHESDHCNMRKWRWGLTMGVIVAMVGALVAMATRFIK